MVYEGALEYADTSLSCCGWGFDLAVAGQRAMELAMLGGKAEQDRYERGIRKTIRWVIVLLILYYGGICQGVSQ